jgi:hypothetical protein
LAPLLKTPAENPHATLVTLFQIAVDEARAWSGKDHRDDEVALAMKFLAITNPIAVTLSRIEFDAYRIRFAGPYLRDVEPLFEL